MAARVANLILILQSSNGSPSVTSFETSIVDWFISHLFTCEFGAILSPAVVTLSAKCSVAVSRVNMGEINQSTIEVSNGITLGLRLEESGA